MLSRIRTSRKSHKNTHRKEKTLDCRKYYSSHIPVRCSASSGVHWSCSPSLQSFSVHKIIIYVIFSEFYVILSDFHGFYGFFVMLKDRGHLAGMSVFFWVPKKRNRVWWFSSSASLPSLHCNAYRSQIPQTDRVYAVMVRVMFLRHCIVVLRMFTL